MMVSRILIASLLLGALPAAADSAAELAPFDFFGYHTGQRLADAMAHTQNRGGTCRVVRARPKVGGQSALCEFPPPSDAGEQPSDAPGLKLGELPIHEIELEAHGDGERVSNAAFFFSGDHELAVAALKARYGEPLIDTAIGREYNWSNSRRLLWRRGSHRLSLIDSPQMVLLASDNGDPAGD
jgi:hypothetical protein